ncbi:hypothetical protein N665_0039s0050 [Sinapis alba]|nr:hypothetical protein N665_0039s0050 [Sinapis alba]
MQQAPWLISECNRLNSLSIMRFSHKKNGESFSFDSFPDFSDQELKLVNANIRKIPSGVHGIHELKFIEKLDLSGNDFENLPVFYGAELSVEDREDFKGFEETQRKGFPNNISSGSYTTGISGIHFAPGKAFFFFPCADPRFGGYLPQATVWNPQMVGRAKLIKAPKPNLHESRHVHALKRPRGSGGRLLNTKKLQESKEPNMTRQSNRKTQRENMSGCVVHQMQNSKDRDCSTTSGSDITSVSDGVYIFGHSEFQLSDCPSQRKPTMYVHGQSNDMHGGRTHAPLLCPDLRRLEYGLFMSPQKGKSSLAVFSLVLGSYFTF